VEGLLLELGLLAAEAFLSGPPPALLELVSLHPANASVAATIAAVMNDSAVFMRSSC
jgi:hypothetical protein